MDRSKTTLIVGSGAHVPYGYPTNQILGKKIEKIYYAAKNIKDDPEINKIRNQVVQLHYGTRTTSELADILQICRLMPPAGVYGQPSAPRFSDLDIPHEKAFMYAHLELVNFLEGFLLKFLESGAESIDQFLIDYKIGGGEYELGKLLLSSFLFNYEIQPKGHDRDWIELYIDHFIYGAENLKSIEQGNVHNIYTFNYDLNFERRIFWALKNRMLLSDDQASAIVKKIEIKHVYGSFLTGVGNRFDYKYSEPGDVIVKTTHNISLVRGDSSWNLRPQFQKDFEKSEKVIFLGFGFHPSNFKNLFDGLQSTGAKTCLSTNKFITPAFIKRTNDRLRSHSVTINFFERASDQMDSKRILEEYLF